MRKSAVRIAIGLLAMAATLPAQAPAEITTANAMARVTKKVAPDYPVAARQLNVSGQQEVQLVVSAAGDVEEAKVVKGNAIFTQASVAAAKQWKFQPLMKDGQAVKFTAVILFNYQK